MRSYQFECVKDVDGQWVKMDELTPIVTAETPTAAMNDPVIVTWCNEKQARISKVVVS